MMMEILLPLATMQHIVLFIFVIADVADPDMAKAAQWCTEQGTMATKGDRFEPEGWTPKFKVIEVWNKAFPKQ